MGMISTKEMFGYWTEIDKRDLKTVDDCEKLAGYLFEEIAIRHGPIEALRIFSGYGKPTKSEIRRYNQARVLKNFRDSGRNKHQFAIQLTKRGINKGKNPKSLYRKLNRKLNDPKTLRYLEWLDYLELSR